MVTAVSSSATVGQVGIKTEFTTGNQINSPLLPQSIYVIGQGNTNITYTSEAVKLNTAALVASKYGNGSPLHLAAKAIHGLTNASVPVYFYGLQENGAGVAATNDIIISGWDEAARAVKLYTNDFTTLSIDDEALVNNLQMYPNPTNGVLNISSKSNQKITKVQVFDLLGRTVENIDLIDDKVDMSRLSSGVYLLKLTAGNSEVTKRIIKE